MDCIVRLEELTLDGQELSAGLPSIQYRGGLMRLMTLNGEVPRQGKREVVVLASGSRVLGLVTDAIIDIFSAPYAIQIPSPEKYLLGSMVIGGKATDIVDVATLLHTIAEAAEREKA